MVVLVKIGEEKCYQRHVIISFYLIMTPIHPWSQQTLLQVVGHSLLRLQHGCVMGEEEEAFVCDVLGIPYSETKSTFVMNASWL